MWGKESKEVREEVFAYIEEEYINALRAEDEDEEEEEIDAEERARRDLARVRQKRINLLPATVHAALEQISAETGFVGFFSLVGPEPKEGGNLSVVFGHYGTSSSSDNQNIVTMFPEIKQTMSDLLLPFGNSVFLHAQPIKLKPGLALTPLHHLPLNGVGRRNGKEHAPPSPSPSPPSPSPPPQRRKGKERARPPPESEPPSAPPSPSPPPPPKRVARRSPPTTIDPRIVMRTAPQPPRRAVTEIDSDMEVDPDIATNNPTLTQQLERGLLEHEQEHEHEHEHEHDLSQQTLIASQALDPGNYPALLEELIEGLDRKDWVYKAVMYLTCYEGHPLWSEVIVTFIHLERHLVNVQGQFTTAKRPWELSAWMRKGRPTAIKSLDSAAMRLLRESLYEWWIVLQPDLRVPPTINQFSCDQLLSGSDLDQDDWSSLMQGSQNGFYGVLACLAWWMKAWPDRLLRNDFNSLINDVLYVMNELLCFPCPPPRPPRSSQKKPRSR
ncbi:hypothetical protein ONZ45_g7242 [Pleurotus djamor]|nr:hypothetical protein ONZ45_g7242 [Pleurotus djamor]